MRRRDALRSVRALAGAEAASPLLPGCGDDPRRAGADAGILDGGAPDSAAAEGITPLVVVMMENRSYDDYPGARSLFEGLPGDGLVAGMANPDVDGSPVATVGTRKPS